MSEVRRIGIGASGSTVLETDIILAEDKEKNARAEDLFLIDNRNSNRHARVD